MTSVLVVEDQHVLASALEVAIGAQPDLTCTGTAATVAEALALLDERGSDVVLMDIQLPGMDGIEGTRRVVASHPGIRVLILTGTATPGRLAAATSAGAAGFLAKDSALPEILAAVRNPVAGTMVVEEDTMRELAGLTLAGADPPSTRPARPLPEIVRPRLTTREREILALMSEGLSPRAIARNLVVSLHTVRGHIKSLMTKLGAHSQLEAVVIASRSGLLPGEDAHLGGPERPI